MQIHSKDVEKISPHLHSEYRQPDAFSSRSPYWSAQKASISTVSSGLKQAQRSAHGLRRSLSNSGRWWQKLAPERPDFSSLRPHRPSIAQQHRKICHCGPCAADDSQVRSSLSQPENRLNNPLNWPHAASPRAAKTHASAQADAPRPKRQTVVHACTQPFAATPKRQTGAPPASPWME